MSNFPQCEAKRVLERIIQKIDAKQQTQQQQQQQQQDGYNWKHSTFKWDCSLSIISVRWNKAFLFSDDGLGLK